MRPASVTSPFCASESSTDWVQWQKDQPISGLQESGHTDCRSEIAQENSNKQETVDTAAYVPAIHRPQYNAVIDRFSQARKRTGAFSSWTT